MNTRFWTFNTLVGAFLDLFIAYFLLCASTVALFAVKFLGLFGLSLPYRSLLVDCPVDKVSGVRFLVTRKFPFDSVFDPEEDLNVELEGEASNSGVGIGIGDSGVVIGNGIGWLDLKGKHSCVSCSSNWVTCDDQESNNGEEYEDSFVCSDVGNRAVSRYHEDVVSGDPNEADKDKMIVLLTHELEQSQAARAVLYSELEKERNAAASAAEEAMSMILRLQEEKAVVKMESNQYQRMIEEKSAFDAEEMNILKEIVLRREREKHFLEKQVEAYSQMIRVENDRINGENNQDFVQDVDFLKQDPEKTIPIDASRVYDVHVIESKANSSEKLNGIMKKSDQELSGSEMCVGLPPVRSKSTLRRYSTSALDNERTRLDTEVEWLRERLRIVQEGRVKLKFSVEESLQRQLLEDIARQLQEIRMLTEPQTARQASLPLPSSKGGLTKKRRCRSVSSGHAKSS